ncbi:Uncharacterised protein [Enterobacter kobei]|nr:Uncharacterised protein [Enterobacter kobei]
MDNFGIWREGIQFASNAVVKTRTHGDEQIALLHRQVCGFSAVHPQHAEIVWVVCINRTKTFQRAGGRHLRYRDKFTQGRHGLRHADTPADVQHRLFRLRQHLARLFNLCMRERIVAFHGGEVRFQFAECNLDIFRDIHQNGARAARARHFERFGHYARQLIQRLDKEAVLGAGQR